jgi:hypothetical protein
MPPLPPPFVPPAPAVSDGELDEGEAAEPVCDIVAVFLFFFFCLTSLFPFPLILADRRRGGRGEEAGKKKYKNERNKAKRAVSLFLFTK